MDLKTLIYEKRGGIAYVTMNRPESMNAYNSVMCQELPQVWEDFRQDDDVRVAILTGAGEKSFSSGIDVKEMATTGEAFSVQQGEVRLTARQCKVWKPVITAVNGYCIGGGLHFVGDADITICSEKSTFFDTHLRIGSVMAVEAIGLSRKIPMSEVLRMVLTSGGYRINAQRAYEIGLVSEVVPQDRLMSTATGIAEQVAECAPLAVRGSVEAIWRSLNMGTEDAMVLGRHIIQENWHAEDFTEGPRDFAERRKPAWKGR